MLRRMTRPTLLSLVMLTSACASTPAPAAQAAPAQSVEPAAQAAPDATADTAPATPAAAPADAAPMSIEAPADVAAAPPEAEVTASGLASRVLRAGTGEAHPGPTASVTVHYTGWTPDGNRFDSSITRGQPASFPLDKVIAGWTEGVQLMVVGERRRFWIPGGLAYDNSPRAGAPKGMLVFDVELLAIE